MRCRLPQSVHACILKAWDHPPHHSLHLREEALIVELHREYAPIIKAVVDLGNPAVNHPGRLGGAGKSVGLFVGPPETELAHVNLHGARGLRRRGEGGAVLDPEMPFGRRLHPAVVVVVVAVILGRPVLRQDNVLPDGESSLICQLPRFLHPLLDDPVEVDSFQSFNRDTTTETQLETDTQSLRTRNNT